MEWRFRGCTAIKRSIRELGEVKVTTRGEGGLPFTEGAGMGVGRGLEEGQGQEAVIYEN